MPKDKKKGTFCKTKKSVMFAYGLTQLGSRLVTSIALVAIALALCSVKKEAKLLNECVIEAEQTLKSTSMAVRYCNGGD